MELSKQVVSLELAKQMRELEFEQESLFWWYDGGADWRIDGGWVIEPDRNTVSGFHLKNYAISAYTVAELGEMLPFKIRIEKDPADVYNYEFTSYKAKGHFSCAYMCEERLHNKLFVADTEADARAKMLIYLKENDLLQLIPLNREEYEENMPFKKGHTPYNKGANANRLMNNKDSTNISQALVRYESLLKDFCDNGFTEQQASFLIHLLNDYIPIV